MSKIKGNNGLLNRLTLMGFCIGFIFPLIAYLFDFYFKGIDVSFSNVWYLHTKNYFLFVVDLVPIFAALIIRKYGGKYLLIKREYSQAIEKNDQNNDRLNRYIINLSNGNLNEVDIDGEDSLSSALLSLKNSILDKEKEEKIQKEKDDQRRWEVQGFADFSEVIRNNSNDISTLLSTLISNLVKYVDCNQGGIYLLNDEGDKYFELKGSYAFGRNKFCNKTTPWGEGLIGSCAIEKKKIYIKKVPDSYIEITSGLGQANPKVLLLMPMIANDKVVGVIEIASFNEMADYQIEFVSKIAEILATSIANVKINGITSTLLEESRQQHEVMLAQEEEMRQNLEELQATQEEMARQSENFISFTNSVNHTLIRADFSRSGHLIYGNTKFITKLGYEDSFELEDKHISTFLNKNDREWFETVWDGLSRGGKHFEGYMKLQTKQGEDLWTISTYTCVRNNDGSIDKILFLGIDNTEQKNQSIDFEGKMKAVSKVNLLAEFTAAGETITANDKFLTSFNQNKDSFAESTVFKLFPDNTGINIDKAWDDVINEMSVEGMINTHDADNNEHWIHGFFTYVKDLNNTISKIVFVGIDVTKEKQMEIAADEQNKLLAVQQQKLMNSEEELKRRLKIAKQEIKNQYQEMEVKSLRYMKLTENTLDSIVVFNVEKGVIEHCNSNFCKLSGYEKEAIEGKNVSSLFFDTEVDKNNFLQDLIDNKKRKTVGKYHQFGLKKVDGSSFEVKAYATEMKIAKEISCTLFIQSVQ